MKRARVLVTTAVVVLILLFLAFVPIPISRIRGLALVQAKPEYSSQITLKRTALLQSVKVQPGSKVIRGMEMAIFRDPDLEEKIAQARAEAQNASEYLQRLTDQKSRTSDPRERARIEEEMIGTVGKRGKALATLHSLELVQKEELIIRAPRDGIVGQAPHVDDIGRMFEGARDQPQTQPIFTVHEEGKFRVCVPLVTSDYNRLRQDLEVLRRRNRANQSEETLWINLRVHGLDASTWRGTIDRLDESEAKYIPIMLSSRANGPVPVHPPNPRAPGLIPQTQHYLVYINLTDEPDPAMTVGAMAQVKIYLRPETCLQWAWRTVNDLFNLRLI